MSYHNNNFPATATGGNNTNAASTDFASTISQFAQAAFTKQNIEAATNYTKEQAVELKKQAQDGDHSLRFLGVVAGLACVVVGILGLVFRFLRFDIIGALIDFYIVILGAIVMVLEGKNALLPAKLVDNIHKYALFLKFLWGRGSLYFVIGTLLLSQFDLLNLIAGGYMCAVGVLYILVGKRTAAKLKTLRKFIYSEQTLRTRYNEADIEGIGLNMSQFKTLCFNLGLDLTRRELEAAFGHIQTKFNTERLSYQDFQAWWNEDAEQQVDDTSFDFV
ncbi:COPI associated protein [Nitzschia inconspicua]|uniref:COPI associated protein n=1 Tax=Nitzschia inconspicua TaxID=303405 RepID=A0A9K3Q081_9STRA|nr:COPI associated protein [Nitzschia inconspicua]